jgi:DNA-binding NarL/FixJ family response regulator
MPIAAYSHRSARPVVPARILVVDPHPVIGDAVRALVQSTDDLTFAGCVSSARETLEVVTRQPPDLLLLELSLEDAYGLDLAAQLLLLHPKLRILIYTMYTEDVFAERAIEAGAAGFLMKRCGSNELLEGIRRVLRDETYLSAATTSRLLGKITRRPGRGPDRAIERLTHRELAVLLLLGEGASSLDIAGKLSLDRKTVETHRRRVKEKLGFPSISSLLHYATNWRHANGRLEPPVTAIHLPDADRGGLLAPRSTSPARQARHHAASKK